MALVKIFSGSEIIAMALDAKLQEKEITTLVKNNLQSARVAGFGNTDLAVEIFINEADREKADPIIDDFKMNL
ncbi:DUF2007 domain-containing protein [Flavobacterium gelidilacus]|jgi:Uri superfamily endonuclease|uniref:putative signal transducing protein n=1 Tax=Flavobacterium gelidilacus TaxID=206041 RepID=UPI00040E8927|nr:DUF2007 domain-containing protein [Flavobacterium gelidilacus]|tara:strand:+ start:289 stop:507 length:219 start_codon:yes stop_codon:yes gene_type:complete